MSNSNLEMLFAKNSTFNFNNTIYKVLFSGKPSSSKGNPKTDLYVLIQDTTTLNKSELKITFKDPIESLLEEKLTAESASTILGSNWSDILNKSVSKLESLIKNQTLVFKNKKGRTNAGSILLGWKLELSNSLNGELSEKLVIDNSQLLNAYSGENLSDDVKNSFVNGIQIPNSGVANMLLDNTVDNFISAEDVFLNLSTINTYIFKNNSLYFNCKPFNYRSFKDTFDGNKPLGVSVDWSINNDKLNPILNPSSPLSVKGSEVASKLRSSLNELNIKNTDDITEQNIIDFDKIVY